MSPGKKKEKALTVLTKLYGVLIAEAKLKEIDDSLAVDHHKPRISDLYDKTAGRIRPIV